MSALTVRKILPLSFTLATAFVLGRTARADDTVPVEEPLAELSAYASDEAPAVKADALPPSDAPAVAQQETHKVESHEARDVASNRKAPELVKAPFEAEGFWMNAFYFVRSRSENWISISEKLYGRADRADMLRKWNPGKRLHIGQVVYYNSPSRPDDAETIKVFAEDFGAQLEEITVQKGDTLSKLGEARYGNIRSWKELAAMNPDIPNPDVIEVGQKIRLQPKDVDTKAVLQQIMKEVSEHKAGLPGQKTQSAQVDQAQTEVASNQKDSSVTAMGTVANNDELPPPSAVDAAPPVSEPVTQAIPTPSAKVSIEEKPYAPPSPVSFKITSVLGAVGTLLLLTAVGMIIFRKLRSFRKGVPGSNPGSQL